MYIGVGGTRSKCAFFSNIDSNSIIFLTIACNHVYFQKVQLIFLHLQKNHPKRLTFDRSMPKNPNIRNPRWRILHVNETRCAPNMHGNL